MADLLGDFSIANLSISGVLLLVVVFGVRALIKGDLVPRSHVELMVAERDARITAQAEALKAAPKLAIEQQAAITTLTDSVRDFAEASQLQVRVARAMHDNLTGGTE